MKIKIILCTALFFAAICLNAAQDTKQYCSALAKQQKEEISKLKAELKRQKSVTDNLLREVISNGREIDNLKVFYAKKYDVIEKKLSYADIKIKQTDAKTEQTAVLSQQLSLQQRQNAENAGILGAELNSLKSQTVSDKQKLSQKMAKSNRLWGYCAGGLIILGLMFWFILYRRQKNMGKFILGEVEEHKKIIEEKFISLCSGQTKVLENMLCAAPRQTETDHSLALKVADEITLMERNMSFMDSSIKGYKQLKRSIGNLKDKMTMQGYEIPELLGKKFDLGMNLTVLASFPDDKLAAGEERISKVIKPQVNFNGKMIQAAQIEVSVGG